MLSPAVKRRGPPRRQGLCSHLAHKWATSDFVLRSEALRTIFHFRPLFGPGEGTGEAATFDFFWFIPDMAKLQLGQFPIPTNGYVVS